MRHALKPALLVVAVLAGVTVALAQDISPGQVIRPSGVPSAPLPTTEALRRGEALFSDKRLSTNDMSCITCHADLQSFNDSFRRPYPHKVQMAQDMAGLDEVSAETMVQFCMLVPMAARPFAWSSPDLTALTAYVTKLQGDFARK